MGVDVAGYNNKYADVSMGLDAPGGVPVGTLAIGKPGATNAGLLAVSILSNSRPGLRAKLRTFRDEQTEKVRQVPLP